MPEKKSSEGAIGRRYAILAMTTIILIPASAVGVTWYVVTFPDIGIRPLYKLLTGETLPCPEEFSHPQKR